MRPTKRKNTCYERRKWESSDDELLDGDENGDEWLPPERASPQTKRTKPEPVRASPQTSQRVLSDERYLLEQAFYEAGPVILRQLLLLEGGQLMKLMSAKALLDLNLVTKDVFAEAFGGRFIDFDKINRSELSKLATSAGLRGVSTMRVADLRRHCSALSYLSAANHRIWLNAAADAFVEEHMKLDRVVLPYIEGRIAAAFEGKTRSKLTKTTLMGTGLRLPSQLADKLKRQYRNYRTESLLPSVAADTAIAWRSWSGLGEREIERNDFEQITTDWKMKELLQTERKIRTCISERLGDIPEEYGLVLDPTSVAERSVQDQFNVTWRYLTGRDVLPKYSLGMRHPDETDIQLVLRAQKAWREFNTSGMVRDEFDALRVSVMVKTRAFVAEHYACRGWDLPKDLDPASRGSSVRQSHGLEKTWEFIMNGNCNRSLTGDRYYCDVPAADSPAFAELLEIHETYEQMRKIKPTFRFHSGTVRDITEDGAMLLKEQLQRHAEVSKEWTSRGWVLDQHLDPLEDAFNEAFAWIGRKRQGLLAYLDLTGKWIAEGDRPEKGRQRGGVYWVEKAINLTRAICAHQSWRKIQGTNIKESDAIGQAPLVTARHQKVRELFDALGETLPAELDPSLRDCEPARDVRTRFDVTWDYVCTAWDGLRVQDPLERLKVVRLAMKNDPSLARESDALPPEEPDAAAA